MMENKKKEVKENPLVLEIDGLQHHFRNEWEKTCYEKTSAIYKILKGLNVYEAKIVLEKMNYAIDSNAIIC